MARPRFDGHIHTVRLSLRLREGQHDDLIAWFLAMPERGRAAAVLTALRQGGGLLDNGGRQAVDEAEFSNVLDAMMF
ncbi:MAG: hypothetical protein IAE79_01615 [Anaerolinea sp.]|nr:hypothetical protein [Anaerolinea sp.]